LLVSPRFAVALALAVALRFAVERAAGLLAGLRVVDLGCGICSLSLCSDRTGRGYTNRARV
jgi:predicted RNA methylase